MFKLIIIEENKKEFNILKYFRYKNPDYNFKNTIIISYKTILLNIKIANIYINKNILTKIKRSIKNTKNIKMLTKIRIQVISFINDHAIDYPTPSNLNYLWGFGFLATICLIIQILSGIFLAMHVCF